MTTQLHTCEDHDHEEDAISFEDFNELYDESIEGMTTTFIEASHKQTQLALELTKLIVEKSAAPLNEQAILSIFEKALTLLAEKSPLKNLVEKVCL